MALDEEAFDEVVSDEEGGGVAMLIGPSRLNIGDPFLLTDCLKMAFDNYRTLYGSCIGHDSGIRRPFCSVEIESNAKLILAWHLGVAAHAMRGSLRRNCVCHAFCRQNNSHWFELAFSMNSLHHFEASRRS